MHKTATQKERGLSFTKCGSLKEPCIDLGADVLNGRDQGKNVYSSNRMIDGQVATYPCSCCVGGSETRAG